MANFLIEKILSLIGISIKLYIYKLYTSYMRYIVLQKNTRYYETQIGNSWFPTMYKY